MELENQNQVETLEEMGATNGDDFKKPKSPSSGDSSDDSDADSMEDDDSLLNEELQALELQLSTDPLNYDAHVQYIKLLRKMGEIEKLRQAREAMSAIFPLTPSMWQDWAKDEASLSTGPEVSSVVQKLYERGVFDYLSVSLWCDYLNYIQESDPSVCQCSADGISKARSIFERAVTAAGLHVAEGNKIWEAYREFEQAILCTIDDADTKAKESQVQRIRSIFHRQLTVPLHDMGSTLLAFKAWEAEQGNVVDAESDEILDGIPSHVKSTYRKATEMYNARAQHEENISKQGISEAQKLENYMNYLNFEKSVGDPARVQVLYERAVSDFPVSSKLWLDYTHYLDKTLKVVNVVRNAYIRATKSCSWVGELWVRYLLALERGRASEQEISTVYEKSLQCTFSTVEEYLDVFLTRVDGLRRRLLYGNGAEGELDFSLVRQTLQHASEYLSPQLRNTHSLLHLYAYWARLELNLGKDLAAARGVWESLLKISGTMLEAWLGYIAMETELGHITAARSIYKRCYCKRFDSGLEDICHSWLRFEREYGTLEDFDHALQKVTPRLEELQQLKMQQETKAFDTSVDRKEKSNKKNAHEKRKGGPDSALEQSPAKRQKQASQTQKRELENNKDAEQNLKEVNEAEKTKSNVGRADSTHEIHQKDLDSRKNKGYTDECTAFVSNLNLKATSEDLRGFFSEVGGVVSVRILHDKFTGKSRGLAYVDFTDEEHLAAGIAKNKQMLLGKKLSIARSDPKKGGQNNSKQRSHTTDRSGNKKESASDKTSKDSTVEARNRDASIQLKGKTKLLVPRNVRALGQPPTNPKTPQEGDEQPKSNDEFRKMFIKG